MLHKEAPAIVGAMEQGADKAKGNNGNYTTNSTAAASAKPLRKFTCSVPGCLRAGSISRAITGPSKGKPDHRVWWCARHFIEGHQ